MCWCLLQRVLFRVFNLLPVAVSITNTTKYFCSAKNWHNCFLLKSGLDCGYDFTQGNSCVLVCKSSSETLRLHLKELLMTIIRISQVEVLMGRIFTVPGCVVGCQAFHPERDVSELWRCSSEGKIVTEVSELCGATLQVKYPGNQIRVWPYLSHGNVKPVAWAQRLILGEI